MKKKVEKNKRKFKSIPFFVLSTTLFSSLFSFSMVPAFAENLSDNGVSMTNATALTSQGYTKPDATLTFSTPMNQKILDQMHLKLVNGVLMDKESSQATSDNQKLNVEVQLNIPSNSTIGKETTVIGRVLTDNLPSVAKQTISLDGGVTGSATIVGDGTFMMHAKVVSNNPVKAMINGNSVSVKGETPGVPSDDKKNISSVKDKFGILITDGTHQELETVSNGNLSYTTDGTNIILTAKHNLLNCYTQYTAYLLIGDDLNKYQAQVNSNGKAQAFITAKDAIPQVQFQTGSAIGEATHVQATVEQAQIRVTDDGKLHLTAIDEYSRTHCIELGFHRWSC
ncbi:hypothetical protein PP175_29655 (plasmid) [Aneurinibacillus sp. Ricciae_BoGa-3]|uniref:hypothetical protein n=1 Tax=Aneurinibacillus sp. Ricciae_BoGa-3 TaxID=3022697 RepID=UPI0023404F6D|nr:hypothetical protein [Aneurinibacillus sp. Ricciae_BoGa-3]WCK57359.1 hypothetical protein PP175_29655 [Aneurinibacillus sp. Ricciae_BoGa-3]